jgi:methylated-DNA-[protein]-cysteine S-methyltransferase
LLPIFNNKQKEYNKIPTQLQNTVLQLKESFEGNRNSFNFKLNQRGTDFYQKVSQELLNIPFEKTTSYQEL